MLHLDQAFGCSTTLGGSTGWSFCQTLEKAICYTGMLCYTGSVLLRWDAKGLPQRLYVLNLHIVRFWREPVLPLRFPRASPHSEFSRRKNHPPPRETVLPGTCQGPRYRPTCQLTVSRRISIGSLTGQPHRSVEPPCQQHSPGYYVTFSIAVCDADTLCGWQAYPQGGLGPIVGLHGGLFWLQPCIF